MEQAQTVPGEELAKPKTSARLDRSLLRALVLIRTAAGGGATRTDLKKDIAPLAAHKLSPAEWRQGLDIDIGVLKADGLVAEKSGRLRATDGGLAVVLEFLGVKKMTAAKSRARKSAGASRLAGAKTAKRGQSTGLPEWTVVRDKYLMALPLGLKGAPQKQLDALSKPDGLRAVALVKAYGLKLKGVPTPAKLRVALAMVALERAFGNQVAGGLASGGGLSAKASRLLAGQLAARPRDFGTDRRLIASLCAEAVGALQSDVAALQTTLLRKLLAGETVQLVSAEADKSPEPAEKPPAVKAAKSGTQSIGKARAAPAGGAVAGVNGQVAKPPAANGAASKTALTSRQGDANGAQVLRPDLAGFSKEVQRQAEVCAKGWPGDRKAFISHVWHSILSKRPEWGLSAIEFKCMLAEAHQAGHILLAYADLKDKSNIKDVQESAISFKNTVWHYVRVED